MHYSNFIKSKVGAPKLDTTVVICGAPSTYTTTTTTTSPETMSEASSDIKELAEYNETMKEELNDDYEHHEIPGAADTAAIILENIKSKLIQGTDEYPDVDPDDVDIPETTEADDTIDLTEAINAADSQSNSNGEITATLSVSSSNKIWDLIASPSDQSIISSTIDTDDYVSKIINNGSNSRSVSSVSFDETPDDTTASNPFNNETESEDKKPVETEPASVPVETISETKTEPAKTEETPKREHPLAALFKNPEAIFRITQVLEHAKEIAEAEAEIKTNLNQEEMEFVMGLLMDLGEKYFHDIPLTDTPDYWFIANIPVDMYNAILNSYNDDSIPDILNPVVTLYISMCEEPELAYGRFLKIFDDELYDKINLIKKLNADYLELIKTDEEEDAAEETNNFEYTEDDE